MQDEARVEWLVLVVGEGGVDGGEWVEMEVVLERHGGVSVGSLMLVGEELGLV